MSFRKEFNRQYDQNKTLAEKAREQITKILDSGNNIDTLIEKKVQDYILLEEQPMGIKIGERVILVGNFTYKTEYRFFHEWAEIVAALSARIVNMEIAEERRKELLEKGGFHLLADAKYMLEFLLLDEWLFKRLVKLIDRTVLKQQGYFLTSDKKILKKWKACSRRYFENNVTKEKLIQICFLVYFYNFDAVKKNISVAVNKMNLKSLTETYMYHWLRNLAGLSGKFTAAQAPSIDYAFRDKPKIPTSRPRKENK